MATRGKSRATTKGRTQTKQKSDEVARSGCEVATPFSKSENKMFIHGWKADKREGMLKFKVFQTDTNREKGIRVSENGTQWISVKVVVIKRFCNDVVRNGMMKLDGSHTTYVPDWNIMLKPTAPNGGYVGKYISK